MTSKCFREGNDPNHATHRATARCFPMYDMTDAKGNRVRNTNMQILSNLAVCDLSDEAMPQVQEDLRRVAAHNAAGNGYTVDRPEDLATTNDSVLPLLEAPRAGAAAAAGPARRGRPSGRRRRAAPGRRAGAAPRRRRRRRGAARARAAAPRDVRLVDDEGRVGGGEAAREERAVAEPARVVRRAGRAEVVQVRVMAS